MKISMNIHGKKAFSLIELSIVILIIGILIAGVTQSSRLIKEMKISTARSITQSSPVSVSSELALWLEPTMESSFIESESEDETQLSRWNDINYQSTSKFFAVKTASSDVLYERDGINELPSVKFIGAGGANSFFTISKTTDIADATIISNYQNAFTFFLVSKIDISVDSGDTTNRVAFYNGNTALNGWGYLRNGLAPDTEKRSILFGANINDTATGAISTSAEIVSGTYTGGTGGAIKFYVNGAAQTLDSDTGTSNVPTAAFFVGSSGTGIEPWKGLISEVIIYNRVLKNSERVEIEKYLAKKYKITI